MIGHEDIGVEIACMRTAGGHQQFQVEPIVAIRIKTRLTVIAALGNVLRYSWQMESGRAGHDMASLLER